MTVSYTKLASSFLDKCTRHQRERVERAVEKLPAGDVKRLIGTEKAYRLRVGDVRIVFERTESHIDVIRIGHRGDIYKR